jgi:TPR repeat protein
MNLERAFRWYSSAAEGGDLLAYYNLCVSYEFGSGVEVNLKKAFECIEIAASKDDPFSCYKAGIFLKEGSGCEKNLDRAYEYFLKALKTEDKGLLNFAQLEVEEFQEKGLTKLSKAHREEILKKN